MKIATADAETAQAIPIIKNKDTQAFLPLETVFNSSSIAPINAFQYEV